MGWGFGMVFGGGTDLMELGGGGERFAARFAGKEAGAKALGTGISRGVSWKEIEVRREPGERPTLHWSGRAAERAAEVGVLRTELSLTHSRTVSMAFVVVEG